METQTVMNDIIAASPEGNAEIMPKFTGLPKPQFDLPDDVHTGAPVHPDNSPLNKNDERRLN